MYMRASAAPMIVCTVAPSSGAVARPTLARTLSSESVLHPELVSPSARQHLVGRASARLGAGLRHQNHKLVTAIAEAPVLLAAQLLQPLPVLASNSLPTRCPCTSFTSLKRSRSKNARLNGWFRSLLRLSSRPSTS